MYTFSVPYGTLTWTTHDPCRSTASWCPPCAVDTKRWWRLRYRAILAPEVVLKYLDEHVLVTQTTVWFSTWTFPPQKRQWKHGVFQHKQPFNTNAVLFIYPTATTTSHDIRQIPSDWGESMSNSFPLKLRIPTRLEPDISYRWTLRRVRTGDLDDWMMMILGELVVYFCRLESSCLKKIL